MPVEILRYTMGLHRRALLGWSIALVGLAGLYVSFWPTIEASAQSFNELLDQYPPAVRNLVGEGADFGTPAGYLRAEVFATTAPILLMVYAVGRASGATAGDEERGALELLLTRPVSHLRFALERAGAMALGIFVLVATLFVALVIATYAIGMDIAVLRLAAASLHLFIVTLFLGMLAFGVGAATGRRSFALATGAGVGAAAYLFHAIAPVSETTRPFQRLSPFYYALAADPLRNGVEWSHVALLAGFAGLFLGLGLLAFERRDLAR